MKDSRIRLLVVIGSLARGGAERQVQLLLAYLPRARVAAQLACFSVDPANRAALEREGIAVSQLPPGLPGLWWGRVLGTLAALVRRERIDVVHSFLPSLDIIAPMLRAFRPRIRVVTSRRVVDEALHRGHLRLLRLTGHLAHAVVGNSADVVESVRRMENLPERKLHHIPNGVPPLEAIAEEERLKSRETLGVSDAFVVVYLANFRPGKGHRHLPEVAGELVRRTPRAVFLLAGEKQRGARYRETAAALTAEAARLGVASHLRYLGVVHDVRALFAAADAALNLSDVEGMSNAVMEAMAHGRPVVATDAGGARELIRDGTDGWLVPRERRIEAAAYLARLAGDSDLRRTMGESARRRMQERFSVETMAEAYASLYERLAGAATR